MHTLFTLHAFQSLFRSLYLLFSGPIFLLGKSRRSAMSFFIYVCCTARFGPRFPLKYPALTLSFLYLCIYNFLIIYVWASVRVLCEKTLGEHWHNHIVDYIWMDLWATNACASLGMRRIYFVTQLFGTTLQTMKFSLSLLYLDFCDFFFDFSFTNSSRRLLFPKLFSFHKIDLASVSFNGQLRNRFPRKATPPFFPNPPLLFISEKYRILMVQMVKNHFRILKIFKPKIFKMFKMFKMVWTPDRARLAQTHETDLFSEKNNRMRSFKKGADSLVLTHCEPCLIFIPYFSLFLSSIFHFLLIFSLFFPLRLQLLTLLSFTKYLLSPRYIKYFYVKFVLF